MHPMTHDNPIQHATDHALVDAIIAVYSTEFEAHQALLTALIRDKQLSDEQYEALLGW